MLGCYWDDESGLIYLKIRGPPRSTLFPNSTLFRSVRGQEGVAAHFKEPHAVGGKAAEADLVDAGFEVSDGIDALGNGEDKLIGASPASIDVVARQAIQHLITVSAGDSACAAAFCKAGGEVVVTEENAYLWEGPAAAAELYVGVVVTVIQLTHADIVGTCGFGSEL